MKTLKKVIILSLVILFSVSGIQAAEKSLEECVVIYNAEIKEVIDLRSKNKLTNDHYKLAMQKNLDSLRFCQNLFCKANEAVYSESGNSCVPVSNEADGKTKYENESEANERLIEEQKKTTNTYTPTPPKFVGPTPDEKLISYCSGRAAGSGLVKYDGGVCERVDDPNSGFASFVETANGIIGWVVNIALMIAALMAFYGGWLYLSAATNPSARSKANALFTNIAIGLFLVFAAWFIVKFILATFAKGNSTTNDIGGGGSFSGLTDK